MKEMGILCAALLLLAACASEEKPSISVQLYPAQLAADARGPHYAGWDTVAYTNATDATTTTYVVSPEPLLTEWNIAAFKASHEQRDGTRIITARLNAYAQNKMRDFCADTPNLKRPLGLRVDERWLSFLPLLSPVDDRIALRGFTSSEAEQLQLYLDNR